MSRRRSEFHRPTALTSVDVERVETEGGASAGRAWVEGQLTGLAALQPVPMRLDELVVGTICGGSDGTSGITANPAMGRAFDLLVAGNAACIFEETGELVGCEQHMADRAVTPALGHEIIQSVVKAVRYYKTLGHGSFAAGNAEGGLTTLKEKSMGAYAKSGASRISGLLKPGDAPPCGGLYLLDMIPDGDVRFGFPNINDNVEIADLIACGAHLILFSTGRGSDPCPDDRPAGHIESRRLAACPWRRTASSGSYLHSPPSVTRACYSSSMQL